VVCVICGLLVGSVLKPRVYIFGWPGFVGGADTKLHHLLILLHECCELTVVECGGASAPLCVDGQLELTVGTKRQRTGAVQDAARAPGRKANAIASWECVRSSAALGGPIRLPRRR
jgi:hypothetical protein